MPFTPEDELLLIQKVNQLSIGKEEQLANSGMSELLIAAGIEVHGPLLYPCSGSDVVYPVLLFPKVNEFILIDEHPLFSSNERLNFADLSQLGSIPNLARGMEVGEHGYDYTDVLQQFNRLDVSFNSERFQNRVGALLLARLRTLCGMELKQISAQVDGVYKIVGLCDGVEKTIYYVLHHLGHESKAYQWLLAQNIQFQTLFLKAFAVSIHDKVIKPNVFQQIKVLYPENLQQLAVVAEADGAYSFNRTLPHLLNPEIPYFSTETTFAYGYSNQLVVTNGLGLYPEYPEHLLTVQQLQNQYIMEQCTAQLIEEQKAEEQLQRFLQLDKYKKFDLFMREGLLTVVDKVLGIKIHDSKQFTSRFTAEVITEVLQVAKEMNLDALQLILMPAYTNLKHQESVTRFVERLDASEGEWVRSLSIIASDEEVNFKSSFAIPAAEALTLHGTNLVEISVRVNDQAALAFVEAFKLLQQNGRLVKKLIEPIVSWREETHHAVATISSTTQGAFFIDPNGKQSNENLLVRPIFN